MKPLHSGFGGWLASRIGKRGPVFADRYKSILVEEESYLLELVRYVHNNPVRAGVVADAADSVWSSHREYLGLEKCPKWLKMGYVLGMFSPEPDEAQRLFHQYVMEGKNEGRRPDLCGEGLKNMGRQIQSGFGDGWRVSGPIVGGEAFAAKVLSDIADIDGAEAHKVSVNDVPTMEKPALSDLISVTSSVLGLEPWEFEQQPRRRVPALARRIITYLWVQRFKQPQMDIVRHFCQSSSTVSKWFTKAVSEVNEIDAICDTVISLLPLPRKTSKEKTKQKGDRVRFNLQLEEES